MNYDIFDFFDLSANISGISPNCGLPLFFNDIEPLTHAKHHRYRFKPTDAHRFLASENAIPLTTHEFWSAQKYYPILFTINQEPIPIAVMGMRPGDNVFFTRKGKLAEPVYIPAYARRYPFILANVNGADGPVLAFDPTAPNVGELRKGKAFFVDGEVSEYTKEIMEFCGQFDDAACDTKEFLETLIRLDLLIDGEAEFAGPCFEAPMIFQGFRMVDRDRLARLPDASIAELHRNGQLALITAHLSSLSRLEEVFGRQVKRDFELGRVSGPASVN